MFERESIGSGVGLLVSIGCLLLALTGGATAAGHHSVLRQARQLLVVTTADWEAVPGTMQRYERSGAGKPWQRVGNPIRVVVGKGGMGWGDGAEAVPGHAAADPVKHEGDGKSPAGVFRIGTAFGYAAQEPAGWTMPYVALTQATECVDDVDSQHYNRIVERGQVTPDWKSSEHMRSVGVYYEWGAEVEQNPQALPGDGSCVFLHIWDGGKSGTEGCTAMAKPEVEMLLGWLKPSDEPLLVELPIEKYRQAEKVLHLPSQ